MSMYNLKVYIVKSLLSLEKPASSMTQQDAILDNRDNKATM